MRRRRRRLRRRGPCARTARLCSVRTVGAGQTSCRPPPSQRPSSARPGPRTRCTSYPAKRLNSKIATLTPPLPAPPWCHVPSCCSIKQSSWDLSQGRCPEVGSRVWHNGIGAYGRAGIMTGHKPAQMLPRHVPSVNQLVTQSWICLLDFSQLLFIEGWRWGWVGWLCLATSLFAKLKWGGEVQERGNSLS